MVVDAVGCREDHPTWSIGWSGRPFVFPIRHHLVQPERSGRGSNQPCENYRAHVKIYCDDIEFARAMAAFLIKLKNLQPGGEVKEGDIDFKDWSDRYVEENAENQKESFVSLTEHKERHERLLADAQNKGLCQ